jgi:hypothetical protein
VVEIESCQSGLFFKKALTKLDFPAPDGAATMRSTPRLGSDIALIAST